MQGDVLLVYYLGKYWVNIKVLKMAEGNVLL